MGYEELKALLKKGNEYFNDEEYDKAIEAYSDVIKVYKILSLEYNYNDIQQYKGIYFNALSSKGFCYVGNKDYNKAIELYDNVITEYKALPQEDKNNPQYKEFYFKALISKGFCYVGNKDYNKAIELYDNVITEDKNNPQYKEFYFKALISKGLCYSENKDYNKAIELYDRIIKEIEEYEKNNHDTQYKDVYFSALNNKVSSHVEKEEYDIAIKGDKKIIEEYEKNNHDTQYKWFYFYALNNQGFCYSKSKEYTESIDAYSKVLTEYDKNNHDTQYEGFYFYALRKLGVIYFNKKANIDEFKKIIKKYKILSKEGEIYFTEFCEKLENEYKQKCYTFVSRVIKHLDKQSKEYSKYSNAKNTFNDLKKCISRNKKHLGKHSINAENYLKKSEQYLNELRKRFPIKTAATAFERQKIETIYSNCKITTLNYIEDLNQIKKSKIKIHYINKPEDIVTYCTEEEKSSFVFRGMNRLAWKLTTTFYRSNQSDQETILSNFKHEALNLSDLNFDHYEKIDWLSLMQHHGSPTQLLDWTQSFNIALFFALYSTENEGIPYIAALKYTEIENYEDVKEIIKNKEESKDFYLFAPKLSHKRAALQRSLFTYHPNPNKQEMKLPEGSKLFIINPSLKEKLLQYLKRNGISTITIYGDLDHFSENAKNPNSELLNIAPQASNIPSFIK